MIKAMESLRQRRVFDYVIERTFFTPSGEKTIKANLKIAITYDEKSIDSVNEYWDKPDVTYTPLNYGAWSWPFNKLEAGADTDKDVQARLDECVRRSLTMAQAEYGLFCEVESAALSEIFVKTATGTDEYLKYGSFLIYAAVIGVVVLGLSTCAGGGGGSTGSACVRPSGYLTESDVAEYLQCLKGD